jgi:anti-anti-sigma factor
MPPAALALIEDHAGDSHGAILTISGELDVGTTEMLRQWLEAATEGATRSAVVDLRGVTFLAAGALHAFCDEQERLLDAGQALAIVCDRPALLHLFAVVELDRVIAVAPTRSALARLRTAGRPSEHLASWRARHAPELA